MTRQQKRHAGVANVVRRLKNDGNASEHIQKILNDQQFKLWLDTWVIAPLEMLNQTDEQLKDDFLAEDNFNAGLRLSRFQCRIEAIPMKLENAPALEIDKVLYAREPIPVHVVRERRIVWNLLKHLEESGVKPAYVHDGEEKTFTTSKKAVMEVVFNLDEAHVFFKFNGTSGWVFLVLGNDVDVVSDYTVNLDPFISKFKPEAYA